MPAVKLQKFLGAAPKVAPELLADTAAETAANVKLYSGDLLPYRYALLSASCGQSGSIKTIYPMRNDADPLINEWLSWTSDVDVATATSLTSAEQRIYYTGDGAPKVTNYAMAVDGSGGPYPIDSYDLGLPLPTTAPGVSAASYSQKTISTYARDSGNIATIVTSTAHGLKSGAVVTISGFNDSATTKSFNTQNTTVTVVDTTTLQYYSSGASLATASADTDGRLNLAGGTILRQYVYTWMTPWLEESIPSEPSAELFIKEGQVITISSLPTAPPAGDNFIRGFRLYRTVTANSGAAYLRLRTVWFTNATVSASRTSNVVTLTMLHPHNLTEGDFFKTTGIAFGGVPDSSFDVTDGVIISSVDDYTFTYTAAGSNKALTATSAGTLQYDMAEPGSSAGSYYSGSSFTDNYDVNGLIYPLESLEYDAPDPDMMGIIAAHNNILAGFVDNEVCFSEPGKAWAWPLSYRKVFPDAIVAIAAVSGYILVMTTKYPYIIEGNSPDIMQYSRVDTPYPCVSKRGVVTLPYGVVYPTHGGLATFGVNGVVLVSAAVQDWDTWAAYTNPDLLVAEFYNGKYFASDSERAFMFEKDDQTGGTYVTFPTGFTAAFYDAQYGRFYYVPDTSGQIFEWDNESQPLSSMEWKSKVIVTQEYINVGAARVVAEYTANDAEVEAILAYNEQAVEYNEDIWALVAELGTINGGLRYVDPDTMMPIEVSGALNTSMLNGDPLTQYLLDVVAVLPLSFRLWVEGELMFETDLSNSDIFRLPTGYRSDTFQVGVSGSARVKAIHIGETPYGLRTA